VKLNILIVDDDNRILSVLQSLLTEEKHTVTTCNNGLDAIETCWEQKFDLVITDLMMPGANGIEVLKEVRKIYPDTLVLLITGFASIETAIQAIREGAYDYITKPFKLEEIKIVVKNAGERICLVRENQRLLKELQEAQKELSMVKRIIGVEDKNNAKDHSDGIMFKKEEPLIAGSMLTHYYLENKYGTNQPLFSNVERISTLRDRGFLSEKEFDLCKQKLFKNLKH
jgi:CheY-like chemotaxis protein